MTHQAHNYLHFTKKERNGIVLVLTIALCICLVPYLYAHLFPPKTESAGQYKAALDELASLQKDSASNHSRNEYYDRDELYGSASYTKRVDELPAAELFNFDPNTLSVEGWKKLGVREKTATGIRHYIEKGGRFRRPEDLQKIWGLRPEMVSRLLPYVHIAAAEQPKAFYPPEKYERKPYQPRVINAVDINSGDTAAYNTLPGIGDKLAARIVNFRNRLGGFYSIDQVAETFGLPDSTFQKIKPYLQANGEGIHKLDLNHATPDELKTHPYIRWQLANVIVQYRAQHGFFKTVADLRKIMIVTDEVYRKAEPYLTVQ